MARDGVKPAEVPDSTELRPGLEFYYEAFIALESERPATGFGYGRIPWGKLIAYCERYAVDEEQVEDFIYLVGEMDKEDLKDLQEKSKKEQSKPTPRQRKR